MAEVSERLVDGRRSTPELVRSIAGDTATLVRKEVELARREMIEAVVAKAKAAVAMGAAAAAVFVGIVFGGAAAAAALDGVMSPWASRLVVAGGFFVLAGIAAMSGILRAKRPPLAPEMTVQTVKEDIEWAKAQLKR